jgi:hypothetical protein
MSTHLAMNESHFSLEGKKQERKIPERTIPERTIRKEIRINVFFILSHFRSPRKRKNRVPSDIPIILFVMMIPRKSMRNIHHFSALLIERASGRSMRRYPAT